MNCKKNQLFSWIACAVLVVFFTAALAAQTPSRVVGTVAEIRENALTVKTDAGESRPVEVPSSAVLKQIAPGEKDLSKAETIPFSSLAVGDRVLVRLDTKAPAGSSVAAQIIAIKQAALAQKQEAERLDWQRRGIGGLVKSIDSATGSIVITSGVGPTAKAITIHTGKTTILRRYAPTSVRFDQARTAPITDIKPGDQIRARGEKSADGAELTAEEAVSGGFRNIAGTVLSIDAAGSTLTVKDLATKKPATIKFSSETQMRKLPDMMSARLALFLKGDKSGAMRGNGAPRGDAPRPEMGSGPGGPAGGPGGPRGGMDPQMILSHAPSIQLSELKKGDAVMVVASENGSENVAITLLAGVEPILEAPSASNLLSNWSMGSGAPEMGQ